MTAITRDMLKACHYSSVIHLDGQGFYQNRFSCAEHPRFTIVDTGSRGTPSKKHKFGRELFVDGEPCRDLDAVAAALNKPQKVARSA